MASPAYGTTLTDTEANRAGEGSRLRNFEPVAVINGLVALTEALIAIAVGFGLVNLTVEQVGLLMAVVIALGNLVKTLWARGQVTPVNNPRDNQGHSLKPV